MAFDVETTMLVVPKGGFSPETRRAIKGVNLMCFLLDDVTYNDLYFGDFRPVLGHILARARLLDKYDDTRLPSLNDGAYHPPEVPAVHVRQWIVDALTEIEEALTAAGRPLVLGDLFRTLFTDPSSPEYVLAKSVRTMYNKATTNNQNELEHFCCPVVAFQEQTVPLLIHGELESFLDAFGDTTQYELFTKQRKRLSKAQLDQLQAAREAHILSDATVKSSLIVIPDIFPPPNGLQCNYTTSTCFASTFPDCFCNDANGTCSAMSYP